MGHMTETSIQYKPSYRPAEAAEALSVSVKTVRRMYKDGRLPYKKAGTCIMIPGTAIRAWLEEGP